LADGHNPFSKVKFFPGLLYNEIVNEDRSPLVDAFRGFAVFCMVIGNFMMNITWYPAWLKHAPDIGFRFVDLGAPAFVFVIGLNYITSSRRRFERDGAWKAVQHFVIRYFAILGLGALFGAGQVLFQIGGVSVNWGVLQAIGVAGLVTLFFIRLPVWSRLVIGLALLAFYQFMLDRFWLSQVLASPHGGLPGSLSWAGLLIIATVLADLYIDHSHGFRNLLAASTFSIILALVLNAWFVISKNRVSAPYVLLSLGLSGWFFCLFHLIINKFGWKLTFLQCWGRNPLLLYVLHLLLQGLLTLPFMPMWGEAVPPLVAFSQLAVILALLSFLAVRLDRKKLYFTV